jgi:chemotaxis protein MotA
MATSAQPVTSAAQARPVPSKSRLLRPDAATLGGLILAFGGILGGLLMEGGKLKDVAQITAALIVLGGTWGAVMVSTPTHMLGAAVRRIAHVIVDPVESPEAVIEELIRYATAARRNGLVSLENDAMQIQNPFLQKALMLAVDGTDLQEIRSMMQLEIELAERRAYAEARVFESAGGYSPTIGIIGAVLGLIQVMKNLANIEEVGHGIAVAFVATVYGVGLANIVLLPASTKMKARVDSETALKELMLEGVVGIVEGMNPKIIRQKLEAYQRERRRAAIAYYPPQSPAQRS